jgi:hypothetical protein
MAATYDLVTSQTFTGDTGTVTFTSFSSAYTDLIIQGHVNGSGNGDVYLRFNGDESSSNYYSLYANSSTTGFKNDKNYATNRIGVIGQYNSSQQSANPLFFEIVIPEYSNSGYNKNGVVNYSYIADSTVNRANVGFMAWQWRNSSAITSIQLKLTTGTFSGRINVYGIKAGTA